MHAENKDNWLQPQEQMYISSYYVSVQSISVYKRSIWRYLIILIFL